MKSGILVALGILLVTSVPADAGLAVAGRGRGPGLPASAEPAAAFAWDPASSRAAEFRRLVRSADGPQAVASRLRDAGVQVLAHGLAVGPTPMAGHKPDLSLTVWLYEWQNPDGSYSEQAAISGHWRATEYRVMDAPLDVIDVRWTAGDLVYASSVPFDGVRRDQHTQGIASFTVDDQVQSWDLFVNFRPVSESARGRWTNVFVNYTHTWFGLRLGITLGTATQGAAGSITITTDGRTWTQGTGVAFLIGSQGDWGPAGSSAQAAPQF